MSAANADHLLLTSSTGTAEVYTKVGNTSTKHTVTADEITAKSYVKYVTVTATLSVDANTAYPDGEYWLPISPKDLSTSEKVIAAKQESPELFPLPVRIAATNPSAAGYVGDGDETIYIHFELSNNEIKDGKNKATFYLSVTGLENYAQDGHKVFENSFIFGDIASSVPTGTPVVVDAVKVN